MDASNLGTKEKVDGKNQRTVLDDDEIIRIVDTFNERKSEAGFSVTVSYADIKAKKFSISPGQYFEATIEYAEISHEEFIEKIDQYRKTLRELADKSNALDDAIDRALAGLSYDI